MVENISAKEVEELINSHPKVEQAAAVGMQTLSSENGSVPSSNRRRTQRSLLKKSFPILRGRRPLLSIFPNESKSLRRCP